MQYNDGHNSGYASYFGRIVLVCALIVSVLLFAAWRIDNPRIERLRMQIIDQFVPRFTWLTSPTTNILTWIESYQSYTQIYEQNQELRLELQQMRAWKEAALQLEYENARLLELNNVQVDAKLNHITGRVLADSGSPFRQTVLLNLGTRDGVIDGWAAMDGIGVVGRISGVADSTARVLLVTDNSSKISVMIEPSGQRALMVGDNNKAPVIEFLEKPELVRAGDRVITSGDGDVFPNDLLVGHIIKAPNGRFQVKLSADIERISFVRLIRYMAPPAISSMGTLIGASPQEEQINEP